MKLKSHLSATCVRFVLPLIVLGLGTFPPVRLSISRCKCSWATRRMQRRIRIITIIRSKCAQYALDYADVVGAALTVSWD